MQIQKKHTKRFEGALQWSSISPLIKIFLSLLVILATLQLWLRPESVETHLYQLRQINADDATISDHAELQNKDDAESDRDEGTGTAVETSPAVTDMNDVNRPTQIVMNDFDEIPEWRHYSDRPRPTWTEKHDIIYQNDGGPPTEHRICLVHVGKTAGSTLACFLGFKYDCAKQILIPGGRLPYYTTHLTHSRFNDCEGRSFAFYLYTLRDPVDRIKSWFAYEGIVSPEHEWYDVKKPLFVDCFTSLNDLAERGLGGDIGGEQCARRAYEAIRGITGFCCHNKFNFQYYYDQMDLSNGAMVLGIRTEHVDEDWNGIERFLGSKEKQFEFPRINQSYRHNKTDSLSAVARQNLCDVLCDEIQVYKKVIYQSVNLGPEQKELSIQELRQSCPEETKEIRTCDYSRFVGG